MLSRDPGQARRGRKRTLHAEQAGAAEAEPSATLLGQLEAGTGTFRRTLRLDLKQAYRFYLDDAARARLTAMGRLKRWALLPIWLLRSLLGKLTSARRLLLILSLGLVAHEELQGGNGSLAGFLCLLLVLMLELKDKLVAHDELAAGRAVQFALMPHASPTLAGWDIWLHSEPAHEVGGDLVDFLDVGAGRHAVAVGDVAGKGLGAALLMAKLQASLRALAPDADSLAELASRLNAAFLRDRLPRAFASLCYLELAPECAQLTLVNAGHLPPLLVTEAGLEVLPRGEPALGLVTDPAYLERSITLAAGDLLVVYSDGLTDSRAPDGELFGQERAARLAAELRGLPAREAGERFLATLASFAGGEPSSDDLSLAVIRCCVEPGQTSPVERRDRAARNG